MAEEYDDYPEATPEQKRQIATYFLMTSPPDEILEVLKDVKTLVADSAALTDSFIRSAMSDANAKNYVAMKLPAGAADADARIVVAPYGKVAEDRFVDPASGVVYEIDHVAQTVKGETDQRVELPEAVEGYRAAMQDAAKQYLADFYAKGKAHVAVFGDNNGQLTMCITSTNSRLRAYFSGAWRSTYTLNVSSPSQADLGGSVAIISHSFEDGSAAITTDYKRSEKIEVTADPRETARNAMAAIETMETNLQRELDDMYVSLHADTFKSLRRVLPINRTKLNWDTTVHSLANELMRND